VTFEIIELLQAFPDVVYRTVVQQFTRAQLALRVVRSLGESWAAGRFRHTYPGVRQLTRTHYVATSHFTRIAYAAAAARVPPNETNNVTMLTKWRTSTSVVRFNQRCCTGNLVVCVLNNKTKTLHGLHCQVLYIFYCHPYSVVLSSILTAAVYGA